MHHKEISFQQAAWKRLKKNKGAVFGLIIICIAAIVAIFAYFIAPDKTPNANRIIVEIDGEKPGFKQQFLLVKKDNPPQTSFFSQLISGKEDIYNYIPITSYEEKADSIIVQKLIDV